MGGSSPAIHVVFPGRCRRLLCWHHQRWNRPQLQPELEGALIGGFRPNGVFHSRVVVALLGTTGHSKIGGPSGFLVPTVTSGEGTFGVEKGSLMSDWVANFSPFGMGTVLRIDHHSHHRRTTLPVLIGLVKRE